MTKDLVARAAVLRNMAVRARRLAFTVHEPDCTRILGYAKELEGQAADLEKRFGDGSAAIMPPAPVVHQQQQQQQQQSIEKAEPDK